ncbi:unnamed protein product [Lathyrus sativus]|nr:unnamed protein product [Lathyrus sativus]
MKGLLFVFLILVIASHSLCARITPKADDEWITFDVTNTKYGAIGDDNTDDSELGGTIIAPKNMEDWKWAEDKELAWIRFEDISGLTVNGGGQINGQGAPWWKEYPDNESKRPSVSLFI